MRLEDVGLVGNCQFSAHVASSGAVVWCCLPRFDSEPVFGALLDEADGGRFEIAPADGRPGVQRYLENTNVLETRFDGPTGSFRILDFAPRFSQHGRMFRPTQLFRIVEPLDGLPQLRVTCDPRLGWSRERPARVQGSHHVAFEGFGNPLRLTTDLSLSALDGRPIALTERRHLALTWGAPIEEPLAPLCDRFLSETTRYWQRWVKHCNIPPLYQREVIRSALALKLHCFEDTGAIVAATTTSLPEAPGSGRNWDYRYCWLRDAYYVLEAFRLLGHFEEREDFVRYLLGIVADTPSLDLAPLYRIDGRRDLDEHVIAGWPGYEGSGPVRTGNGAAVQRQLDVYGELVLALAPIFLDERFRAERSDAALRLVQRLADKAIAVAGSADAGIWELRTPPQPQTFSSLMCWAGADRMARIAGGLGLAHAPALRLSASRIRDEICTSAWSTDAASFVSTYRGVGLDASLLQIATLRMLEAGDVRLRATVAAVRRGLTRDGWLMRYDVDDGFGHPAVAFVICNFWLVEALAALGDLDEARAVLDQTLTAQSPLGLFAEDYHPTERRLFGNFPQCYSHVGLIHAAFAASPRWHEVL